MSADNVKGFLDRVQSDFDLRRRCQNALVAGNPDATAAAIATLGGTNGFAFTADEYKVEVLSEYNTIFVLHRSVFHMHLLKGLQ